jgi:hypothetical protein
MVKLMERVWKAKKDKKDKKGKKGSNVFALFVLLVFFCLPSRFPTYTIARE